ncbi:MAG: hypothetical protein KF716_15920 [Anaerolineae bacterium]|nr:hypothetical protein [Anaerolineae bacterium]
MSKRKQKTQQRNPESAAEPKKIAAPTTASKRKAKVYKPTNAMALRTRMIGVAVLIVVLIGGGSVLVNHTNTQNDQKNMTMTSMAYVVGTTQNCAGSSPFASAVGFPRGVLDTRANFVKGLALRELDASGNILRTYQHPSWSQAGYLGSFQRDAAGNIFVIPTPYINILDNPPKKANIVYRIDRNTGEMVPLANLPVLAPATPENVYGLLGLTYDCETRSLYVSSVFGSTFTNVAGCIFQLDPNTGEVRSSFEYVDAFGIGVFNSVSGKRLYFGLARTPDVYSVSLDASGKFGKDVRPEFSIAEAGGSFDERAKSITFQGSNQLIVKIMPFDFNLTATNQAKQIVLSYGYDSQADKWLLQAAQTLNGTSINS